jgi:hypothetical protein
MQPGMDILFLVGAAVIGSSKRYWAAVAAAITQLAAMTMLIVAIAQHRPLLGFGAWWWYLGAIASSFGLFLRSRWRSRTDHRRETAELLGAAALFGVLGLGLAGIALLVS